MVDILVWQTGQYWVYIFHDTPDYKCWHTLSLTIEAKLKSPPNVPCIWYEVIALHSDSTLTCVASGWQRIFWVRQVDFPRLPLFPLQMMKGHISEYHAVLRKIINIEIKAIPNGQLSNIIWPSKHLSSQT